MSTLQVTARMLALVALLAYGSALAQNAEVEAIEALAERFVTAQADRDAEGLARLYTDDAILFNSLGQVVEGRQALIAYFRAEFAGPEQYVGVESSETVVLDDAGYNTGTYWVTDSEGHVLVQGYYVAIVNRIDGEWRIHRHINNMILPEMPMPVDGEGQD